MFLTDVGRLKQMKEMNYNERAQYMQFVRIISFSDYQNFKKTKCKSNGNNDFKKRISNSNFLAKKISN